MEYFGIIKPRRVRKVYSKAKGTEVNVYDYLIETLNSESGQNYAFTCSEDKKKALEGQGMRENVLGTMYFYSKSREYTDKEGQTRDINNTFPSNFKPYAQNVPALAVSSNTGTKKVGDMEETTELPF